ncbi:MAG: PdxA family dehydrogenase [Alphaproteobacteria bacterium]
MRAPTNRPRIAMPLGDPNGIGPEIALKASLDAKVRAAALPILVGDSAVIDAYAKQFGYTRELGSLVETGAVALEPVISLGQPPAPGTVAAEAGRAAIAYAKRAIALVRSGGAEAVVAGPHNETAVARAGIDFSGYPGLLAEVTGTDPGKVFLMLVSARFRIVHVTLHVGLRAALDSITSTRVLDAARAADQALKMLGVAQPRIAACGINPHAGEGGLFGPEDEQIVRPAVEAARREGIAIDGPRGADLLLAEGRHDAYLAMYHDQGHIPIKLEGRGNSFGISIGAPVLLSTVAHGSAHDIAGTGTADATAFKTTVRQMANVLAKKAPANGSERHANGS